MKKDDGNYHYFGIDTKFNEYQENVNGGTLIIRKTQLQGEAPA